MGSGHPADGQPLEPCNILTTVPNALVQQIHNRIPVILTSNVCSLWLDPMARDVEPLQALLIPSLAEEMTASPVGTRVSRPANDTPAGTTALT